MPSHYHEEEDEEFLSGVDRQAPSERKMKHLHLFYSCPRLLLSPFLPSPPLHSVPLIRRMDSLHYCYYRRQCPKYERYCPISPSQTVFALVLCCVFCPEGRGGYITCLMESLVGRRASKEKNTVKCCGFYWGIFPPKHTGHSSFIKSLLLDQAL